MKVKFSQKTDEDIIGCYLYGYRNFGEAQAEKYEQDLRHILNIISDNPLIASERTEFNPPIRIHHHAKHYILYVIEDDHILIIRILRDEVDLARHL